MAKCVQNRRTKEARRVNDAEAKVLVEKQGFEYIGKSEYKRWLESQQQKTEAA